MTQEARYFEAAPKLAAFQQERGGIGRGLVIVNRDATNGKMATDYIKNYFPAHPIALPGYDILLVDKNIPLTPDIVRDTLHPDVSSAVYLFGGDSTLRVAAKALMGTDHVLYAGNGGNAGNVSLNLFGTPWSMENDLKKASVGQINPLEISMEGCSEPEIALTVFNAGMLSSGAKVLESAWYRRLMAMSSPVMRAFFEKAVLLPAGTAGVRSFYATTSDNLTDISVTERLVDFSALNARTIGKYSIWPNVDLLRPGAVIAQLHHLRHIPAWAKLVQTGEYPARPLWQGLERSVICDRTVPISYDGHPAVIDANRKMTIRIGKHALNVCHRQNYQK